MRQENRRGKALSIVMSATLAATFGVPALAVADEAGLRLRLLSSLRRIEWRPAERSRGCSDGAEDFTGSGGRRHQDWRNVLSNFVRGR